MSKAGSGDSYPGSQNEYSIRGIGESVAEAERTFGHTDVRTTRLRIFHFFRASRKNNLIGGINPRSPHRLDRAIDEIVELVQKRLGPGTFTADAFRSFSTNDPSRVQISTDFIPHLLLAIPETDWFSEDPRVRGLWRDLVEQEIGYVPYLNRRLHPGGEKVLQATECDLNGDYLLFRLDAPNAVRIAFFRYYAHRTGGVRSMGLRLDREHGFISSKGMGRRARSRLSGRWVYH